MNHHCNQRQSKAIINALYPPSLPDQIRLFEHPRHLHLQAGHHAVDRLLSVALACEVEPQRVQVGHRFLNSAGQMFRTTALPLAAHSILEKDAVLLMAVATADPP